MNQEAGIRRQESGGDALVAVAGGTRFFPLAVIRAADNSRKWFDLGSLDGLAVSLADSGGALQPVLGVLDDDGVGVELISGERRLRAAERAGLEKLEVKLVERPSRAVWLKWNLVENLQREDISPLECAWRIKEMLDLEDDEGGRVWSVASLAAEMGKGINFIQGCLDLLGAPEEVLGAVVRGEVAPEVAALIGGLPMGLRERAADEMVLKRVAGPMTVQQARTHVAASFRRDLRRASFDRHDGSLVPGSPPCGDCEWNGANRDDVEGRHRGSVCLDPGCFAAKCAAHAVRVAEAMGEHGVPVLDAAEAGRIFESHSGLLVTGCGWVDIAARPDMYLLSAAGRADGRCWEELFGGAEVPVVVAFDLESQERRLVELAVAVMAVGRGPNRGVLKAGAGADLLTADEREESRAREKAAARAREGVLMAGCGELFGSLADGGGWDLDWVLCLVRAVCDMGLQATDVMFLCRVLDPGAGRSSSPMGLLEELMARELGTIPRVMAFLTLAINARRLRLEGFGGWCEDESPMWVLCGLAGFDCAGWAGRVDEC